MTAGETTVSATDRRVREALRRAMIGRIATVTPGGWPLIMPLYFVVLDGRIYMNNAATSPTVKNIERHGRALVVLLLLVVLLVTASPAQVILSLSAGRNMMR